VVNTATGYLMLAFGNSTQGNMGDVWQFSTVLNQWAWWAGAGTGQKANYSGNVGSGFQFKGSRSPFGR
jgi:hypothetical protein